MNVPLKLIRLAATVAAAMTLAFPAAAQGFRKGDLTVSVPQMRASVGRNTTTAGYLTIRNDGAEPDRLYFAACACAERVELHTSQMQGGVGRMVRLPSITIPAGGQVTLKPGGAHLMFVGLKGRVSAGQDQTVTLGFARAGRLAVRFPVRTRIDTPASGHGGHGH